MFIPNIAGLFLKLYAKMLIKCFYNLAAFRHPEKYAVITQKRSARMYPSNIAIRSHTKWKRWNAAKIMEVKSATKQDPNDTFNYYSIGEN